MSDYVSKFIFIRTNENLKTKCHQSCKASFVLLITSIKKVNIGFIEAMPKNINDSL